MSFFVLFFVFSGASRLSSAYHFWLPSWVRPQLVMDSSDRSLEVMTNWGLIDDGSQRTASLTNCLVVSMSLNSKLFSLKNNFVFVSQHGHLLNIPKKTPLHCPQASSMLSFGASNLITVFFFFLSHCRAIRKPSLNSVRILFFFLTALFERSWRAKQFTHLN